MSGALTRFPAVGVFGKLPARGDFVRTGLPRDFVDGWDDWLSAVMSATRDQAGDAWLPAFLEAPVWRFALPAGLCGAGAVLGLMLPSVDRAGRYFPLTLAATGEAPAFAIDTAAEAWLDRCQGAGLAGLEKDAAPDAIRAMMGIPDLAADSESCPNSKWWTDGSPRVPACRVTLAGLPDAAAYARMLGALSAAGPGQQPADPVEQGRDGADRNGIGQKGH